MYNSTNFPEVEDFNLNSCPDCGENKNLYFWGFNDTNVGEPYHVSFSLQCSCGCQTKFYDTPAIAALVWNNRQRGQVRKRFSNIYKKGNIADAYFPAYYGG